MEFSRSGTRYPLNTVSEPNLSPHHHRPRDDESVGSHDEEDDDDFFDASTSPRIGPRQPPPALTTLADEIDEAYPPELQQNGFRLPRRLSQLGRSLSRRSSTSSLSSVLLQPDSDLRRVDSAPLVDGLDGGGDELVGGVVRFPDMPPADIRTTVAADDKEDESKQADMQKEEQKKTKQKKKSKERKEEKDHRAVWEGVMTPHSKMGTQEKLRQLQRQQSAFHRVKIIRDPGLDREHPELRDACTAFRTALLYRRMFVFTPDWGERPPVDINVRPVYVNPIEATKYPLPGPSRHGYRMDEDGVMRVWNIPETVGTAEMKDYRPGYEDLAPFQVPSVRDYGDAFSDVMRIIHFGPCKTEAHKRLHILESRFGLHTLMNNAAETECQKLVPHRDFYNVRKIDNHVHHSACMNQKHLLRFIKHKMKQSHRRAMARDQRRRELEARRRKQQQQQEEATGDGRVVESAEEKRKEEALREEEEDEIVIVMDGKPLTLVQVFDRLGLTVYDLNVDTLDCAATNSFQRFDRFNLKYNPMGESSLREIFLKYHNHIKGKYLAEITHQVMDDLESNKYSFAEYRLSIYGRNPEEWQVLSDWVIENKLFHHNVRWMIQIPRLFRIYRKQEKLNTLQEMLDNIFEPLFAVSVDPSSHPNLHLFLQSVVGFDSVDDESLREISFDMLGDRAYDPPSEWTEPVEPPYALFSYYLYANLYALNKLRESKGLTTFAYRPHAGEAGSIEHLVVTFLLARSINHGLKLQRSPALQYLYYLTQIGISMSPLGNNFLFCDYDKSPFPRYFKRGLNVALSTDDPLMIHVTKEPLVEEYGVAAHAWKLSPIDMCELARNSVLQSGFEHKFKAHWLGNEYWKRSVEGNDIRCTNVPDIRIQFRSELLREEIQFIADVSGLPLDMDEVVDSLG